jgi:putative transcriptional regulator
MIQVNLDRLMLDRGVSIDELAEKLGISRKHLWTLRAGKALSINFEILKDVCDALQCTPGDVLTYPRSSTKQRAEMSPGTKPPREAHQQLVLDALANDSLDVDELCNVTGLKPQHASVAALSLELAGLVQLRGGLYRLR